MPLSVCHDAEITGHVGPKYATMNQTTPHDEDMPAQIDSSGGKHGKFHQASAQLHLPVHLERQVQDRLTMAGYNLTRMRTLGQIRVQGT